MTFLAQLIAAMIIVESRGDPVALGEDGELGCLQIKEIVIRDVNENYGTSFEPADALIPDVAKLICVYYLILRAGPNPTAEACARTWKGGPQGRFDPETLSYWQQVQQHMFSLPGEPQGDQR